MALPLPFQYSGIYYIIQLRDIDGHGSHLLVSHPYATIQISCPACQGIVTECSRSGSVGGTGHIGGAVLENVLEQHPDAEITALARDGDKAARLKGKYPKVQVIIGDTASFEVLKTASHGADIIVNTSPDITHDEGIKTILGAMKDHNGAKPYYIHTSGASLIWDEPTGSKEARWWDDINDIKDLCAFKGEAFTHAVTDQIVRDAAPDVNVAIISPGFVGGLSPSIEHPTPITTPAILLTARAFKTGFQIAQGENTHVWIHVADLARMYALLVANAATVLAGGTPAPAPFPLWGPEAYYFGTSEDISFSRFIGRLAPVLQDLGVLRSTEVRSVNVTEAAHASLAGEAYDPDAPPPPLDTWAMHIAIMYGINMRIGASRMEKLGWKAEKGSIADSFAEVFAEHLRLEEKTKANM